MSRTWRFVFPMLFVLLVQTPSPGAGEPVGEADPPNPPEEFSHVIGQSFTLTASVTPTEVFVGDPITLKVSIQGKGPFPNKAFLPQRKFLKILPKELQDNFDSAGIPDKDTYDPKNLTWVFYYQLHPKSDKIKSIPALEFVYYNPKAPADFRYQQTASDEIPITVKNTPPPVVHAPEKMYRLAQGEHLLRSTERFAIKWWFVALALALPPGLSLLGYRLWRWYYPDRAGLLRKRRSRAARRALQVLRRLGSDPGSLQSSAVLTHYLRQRLDLAPVEPTPLETARHLWKTGLSLELTERVVGFYQTTASYYAPATSLHANDGRAQVNSLILAIEEEAH